VRAYLRKLNVNTHIHTCLCRVPIYTGWQFFRHPVQRALGKGYLPRSTTQKLARRGGGVHVPKVLLLFVCVCVCVCVCA